MKQLADQCRALIAAQSIGESRDYHLNDLGGATFKGASNRFYSSCERGAVSITRASGPDMITVRRIK